MSMRGQRNDPRQRRTTELGAYLTELRLSNGLTQQEAADRLGISKAYVCFMERGLRTPPPATLRRLAGAYDILPQELFKKAGYLELPLLSAIPGARKLVADPLDDASAEEKAELARYLVCRRILDSLDVAPTLPPDLGDEERDELACYLALLRSIRATLEHKQRPSS